MNSLRKTSVVSVSMITTRMSRSVLHSASILVLNSSIARKIVPAQTSFGIPQLPELMAGRAIEES